MRVYIAIDFENYIKDYFEEITSSIKNHCIEGSFTRKNNFHLTILFIGEVDELQIGKIKKIIDEAVSTITTFQLWVSDVGVFRRKKTNILWVGIEKNNILLELHKELSMLFRKEKISFYDKLYMPHITLGRRVSFIENATEINKLIDFERISIPVNKVSLMVSKEENGKLNGVPIYQVSLIQSHSK